MDASQIRDLFDRHAAGLILYARQWCIHPDDAVQEAFLALVSHAPVPESPVAWLYHVVKRKAMNLARAEQRRTKYQTAAMEGADHWFDAPHDQQLLAEEVEQSLTALRDIERQVVVMRIWGELTFAQIAAILDLSSSQTHRHYQAALTEMSSHFGDPNDERCQTYSKATDKKAANHGS